MSTNRGFTLIEVMIAMLIFTILIGMSTGFIAAGVNQPFIADRVEPWLELIEKSQVSLQELPTDSPLLNPGKHKDPFPDLKKPEVMADWQLEWQNTNVTDFQAAHFKATTKHHKTIEWYVFYEFQ